MNTRVLGIALAAAFAPATVPAQAPASDTLSRVALTHLDALASRMTPRLTSGRLAMSLPLPLPDARLALPDSASAIDLLPALPLDRRWVRVGKWSLLAAAAGFSAYAMLHSGGDGPDRRAQIGIAGGHLALLGSAGLFILDLRHSRRDPENIPFEAAEARASAGGLTADAGVRDRR